MHEHLRQKPPFFSPLGVVFTNTGSGSLGFSAFAFFSFLAPPSALLPFRPHYVVTLQRDTIYRFHLFLLTHFGLCVLLFGKFLQLALGELFGSSLGRSRRSFHGLLRFRRLCFWCCSMRLNALLNALLIH